MSNEMSEQKRYTAQEMRNMADCIGNIRQSEMPSWQEGEIITGGDLCRSAEMLRQAADAEEELAKLDEQNEKLDARATKLLSEVEQARARLEAVVKIMKQREQWFSCRTCSQDILRAARGESENEKK